MQGGWRQPCVEVDFVSKKYNEFIDEKGYIPDMYNPYNNSEIKDIAPTQSTQYGSTTSSATILIKNKRLQETLETNTIDRDVSYVDAYNRKIRSDDLSGTITARYDDNNKFIAIKNATKQGYLEAHDGDGCYISNIDKKRGTVQKEMIPTLKTSPDIGCVTTDLRIRKLTPKECLRLMGFDDKDYEKIKSIGISRSQIYKQAGNSIVVNVLEAIFKELFSEYIPNLDKWSDLD